MIEDKDIIIECPKCKKVALPITRLKSICKNFDGMSSKKNGKKLLNLLKTALKIIQIEFLNPVPIVQVEA